MGGNNLNLAQQISDRDLCTFYCRRSLFLLQQLSLSRHTTEKAHGARSGEAPCGVSACVTATVCGLLADEAFKPEHLIPRRGNCHSLLHNWTGNFFFFFVICFHLILFRVCSHRDSYRWTWRQWWGRKTVSISASEVFRERGQVGGSVALSATLYC